MSPRNVHNCKIPKEQIAKARKVKRPGRNESSFHLLTCFPHQSPSSAPKLLKVWSVRVTHLSTKATKRKIQTRSYFYPVALTQTFPSYRCCWFGPVLHGVMKMSELFPLYDWLAWAGVWFGPQVTQTLLLSINLPFQGVLTNTLKLKNYRQESRGQTEWNNMRPSYIYPMSESLWVWWSWEEHVKLKNCHEMS